MNREQFQQEFQTGSKFIYNDPEDPRFAGAVLTVEYMDDSHVKLQSDRTKPWVAIYYPYECLFEVLTPTK